MADFKADGVKYAEGLAEALIGKLGLVLMQEYQLLRGLRGQVVLLRDDAALMNALLRMFSEADEGAVDHFVREWMNQVRELAYDGEDCMDIFFNRISWLPRSAHPALAFFQQGLTLSPRCQLTKNIKALRARAIAISERRARYGVYGQALQPSIAFGARVPTSSTPPRGGNNDPSHLFGIADQIKNVSKLLCAEEAKVEGEVDRTRKVCFITGMGGVGKTTLALAVCRALLKDFPFQRLVSVSQQFDPTKIKDEIQVLAGKRYLVVIDDVWTNSAWVTIKDMLPENDQGSRIIVTTRNEDVVNAGGSSGQPRIHNAPILNEKDSKSLFVRRVFGLQAPLHSSTAGTSKAQSDDAGTSRAQSDYAGTSAGQSDDAGLTSSTLVTPGGCPQELKVQMGIIIEKCGGLPLAIVCIANLLARYNKPTSLEMWKRVCNSIGSQLETNPELDGMMQIIALSCHHLPHPLKACMMLLSIFPRGYHIPKWRILRRWISEGLIPEKRGLALLDVAEAYYNELLSRNLIQLVVLSDGVSQGHYRVHDMLHEVIVSKSIEENFLSLVGSPRGGTSSYGHVRRLCIHGDVGYVADGTSMKHVRSLTTFGAERNVGVGKLLDGLAKFTMLRVLDLEDCKDVTNKHMKQVCRLFLLRFLSLNGTKISVLPGAISNLRHLQSLMLWDTQLDVVPESVVNLEKLEHFTFQNKDNPDIRMILPSGLKKMKALQHLVRIQIDNNDVELAKEIGELLQLRELGVVVLPGNNTDRVAIEAELKKSVDKLKFRRVVDIAYL